MSSKKVLASALAVMCCFLPSTAPAQEPEPAAGARSAPAEEDARDAERRRLEAEIARELGRPAAGGRAEAPAPGGAAAPAPQRVATGGNPLARLTLLPDISAIGRAALAYGSYDVGALSPRSGSFSPEGEPRAIFEELELGLQAVVDPYARADVFVAFGHEGAEIEEAFLTTLTLPLGFQLRAGRFFSPFGRINQQHPHVWEFADRPLANERLLAEEVLSGDGLELAWIAPLPWFAELRVAGQSVALAHEEEGEGEGAGAEDALTGLVRVLTYFPVTETVTAGVGVSAARRDEGPGAFRDLAGADLHLRWRPVASRAYVSLQGEVYARRFRGDLPEGVDGGTDTGGYGQVFWKPNRFGYGARYEWAPAAGGAVLDGAGREHRYGLLAGFFPTEFQRVRLQVSYDERPGGADGIEALLHLEFGIGSHGAHPF